MTKLFAVLREDEQEPCIVQIAWADSSVRRAMVIMPSGAEHYVRYDQLCSVEEHQGDGTREYFGNIPLSEAGPA